MSNGYHRYSLLQRALDPTLEPEPVAPDRSVPLIEGEPPEPTLPAETAQQAEDRRKQEDEAVERLVGPQVWAGILANRAMLSWTDEQLRATVDALPPIERFSVFLGGALDTLLLADEGMMTTHQREQMALAILVRAAQIDLPDVPGILEPAAVKREIADVMLGGKVDGAAIDRLRRVQMLLKLAGKPGMERRAAGEWVTAKYLKSQYGIPATRLRSAAMQGRLTSRKSGTETRYSMSAVRKLWPEDVV